MTESAIKHGVSLDSNTWKQKKSKKQKLIDQIWKMSLANEKSLAENRATLEKYGGVRSCMAPVTKARRSDLVLTIISHRWML